MKGRQAGAEPGQAWTKLELGQAKTARSDELGLIK